MVYDTLIYKSISYLRIKNLKLRVSAFYTAVTSQYMSMIEVVESFIITVPFKITLTLNIKKIRGHFTIFIIYLRL